MRTRKPLPKRVQVFMPIIRFYEERRKALLLRALYVHFWSLKFDTADAIRIGTEYIRFETGWKYGARACGFSHAMPHWQIIICSGLASTKPKVM